MYSKKCAYQYYLYINDLICLNRPNVCHVPSRTLKQGRRGYSPETSTTCFYNFQKYKRLSTFTFFPPTFLPTQLSILRLTNIARQSLNVGCQQYTVSTRKARLSKHVLENTKLAMTNKMLIYIACIVNFLIIARASQYTSTKNITLCVSPGEILFLWSFDTKKIKLASPFILYQPLYRKYQHRCFTVQIVTSFDDPTIFVGKIDNRSGAQIRIIHRQGARREGVDLFGGPAYIIFNF